jgi:hypothetical protein
MPAREFLKSHPFHLIKYLLHEIGKIRAEQPQQKIGDDGKAYENPEIDKAGKKRDEIKDEKHEAKQYSERDRGEYDKLYPHIYPSCINNINGQNIHKHDCQVTMSPSTHRI